MKRFNFYGGEVHIKLNSDETQDYRTPVFNLWSSDDIMAMLLEDEVLKRSSHVRDYVIPYVPYARQDRETAFLEPISIKVMADLINGMGARTITVWDPHSDVTPALINNCRVRPQLACFFDAFFRTGTAPNFDAVISPDAGATKKAFTFAERFNVPLIQALKHRDIATGNITHTSVPEGIPDGVKNILVPDDICDGGRTFVELAKVLHDTDPEITLYLYVTHGIFSKGTSELLQHYAHIFCANPKNGTYHYESSSLRSS